MFKVENADFIADKLAAELLPDQEYREVAKNAEEAVRRRLAAGVDGRGRIEFDVDWALHEKSPSAWFLCCADNGDGMDRFTLERYMTTLAVEGAGGNQSVHGNQGMGLKISGPTRHREGLLIRSFKNGEGWMIQIGWDKRARQYGAIPLGEGEQIVVPAPADTFPEFIRTTGSGTVVTFLGNSTGETTLVPAARPKSWLFKYLHRRFFRLDDEAVEMLVRQPAGEESSWPHTAQEASGLASWNMARVVGTGGVWDSAATRESGQLGVTPLDGDPAARIPTARVHWWVFPSGGGFDVSSRTESGGSISVLFQNELHDWRTGSQASPHFARMGVLFGKSRVAFVVEPLGPSVASDFARAHVLVDGTPVFESDTWQLWAEQFRAALPAEIRHVMDEEQARIETEDPERVKRIRDRLKDVMSLLRPRRYRQDDQGSLRAGGNDVTGSGSGADGTSAERPTGGGRRSKPGGTRGIGALLSQLDPDGVSASEVFSALPLEPRWITEAEADDYALVDRDGRGLHDRAAGLVGDNGVTAAILVLNKQFRGYTALVAAVNDWANPEGDDVKAVKIETTVQEWVEQKMIEAVHGLRQLENGSSWTAVHYDDALSPAALTAAFMADRYHTLREVKRQVGVIRSA